MLLRRKLICPFLSSHSHKEASSLLYKYNKESVVLYVGDTNPARKVYQRVGFTDTTDEALCPSNGQFKKGDWLELGFDQSKVNLGHW